jgi:hypothetical protein
VRIVDLDRDGRWEVLFLHKGKIVLWLPGRAGR